MHIPDALREWCKEKFTAKKITAAVKRNWARLLPIYPLSRKFIACIRCTCNAEKQIERNCPYYIHLPEWLVNRSTDGCCLAIRFPSLNTLRPIVAFLLKHSAVFTCDILQQLLPTCLRRQNFDNDYAGPFRRPYRCINENIFWNIS
jgi:hypothetical protein